MKKHFWPGTCRAIQSIKTGCGTAWSRSFGNVVPANPGDCRQGNPGKKTGSANSQNNNSRHGSEMGVFSKQLEIPGFKIPCKIIFLATTQKGNQ